MISFHIREKAKVETAQLHWRVQAVVRSRKNRRRKINYSTKLWFFL
jgi:hypothetical protein